MPILDPTLWTAHLREVLERYDEAVLRQVAGRLIKPRNQWPVEELIDRCVATAENAPVLDRRLEELPPSARRLLGALGHSRQPSWRLGNVVELAMALGDADGLKTILSLFEGGLLYPELAAGPGRLKSFEQWLGFAGGAPLAVFVPPLVAERARREDLGLPSLAAPTPFAPNIQESDGLEWLLRLAILWQQVATGPLRRTQSGEFFKRDLDRLSQDGVLNAPPAENLADVPAPALMAEALAECERLLTEADGEVRAGKIPAAWDEGLLPALASLWASLPCLASWNALDGWRGGAVEGANPYPSAYLLAFLLLARIAPGEWVRPADMQEWIWQHHPYWAVEDMRPSRRGSWIETLLLGLGYQLRLVQATRDAEGAWLVRLSDIGRWVLGLTDAPSVPTGFARTLLVQPNLEIVAYRQGLTPALISRLSRFAEWKNLGSACTLQLGPEGVYRALESGLTLNDLVRTLEQHGTRATPPSVVESLKTWSGKRDRITVYGSAALLEFLRPEELDEALSRGLPAVRLGPTLAVVPNESAIDYRHFRLTGTRDYSLPPEPCVEVASDGVTLHVDAARSDLLLETELPRFAEAAAGVPQNGRRVYRLTPTSLATARAGVGLATLESWFLQRTGQPLSPAARLLLTVAEGPAPELRRHLVLHVATPELADGLLQWPDTAPLLATRLGPTALAVAEEHVEALRAQLGRLGAAVTLAT